MSVPPLSWKAWLRAAAITLALVVHGIFAMPSPHKVRQGDLDSPEGVEELERWRSMLGSLGWEMTTEEISELTITWTTTLNDAHSTLRRPFRPFLRFTGTGQGWALFASPDTYPHRVELYIGVGRDWIPVYRRNHPTLDFLDGTLRYRRVRGIYDGSTGKQRVIYWNLARFMARKTLLAHPEANRVRMQMVRTHTTLPWEPEDHQEIVRVKRVFRRSAILPEDGLVP